MTDKHSPSDTADPLAALRAIVKGWEAEVIVCRDNAKKLRRDDTEGDQRVLALAEEREVATLRRCASTIGEWLSAQWLGAAVRTSLSRPSLEPLAWMIQARRNGLSWFNYGMRDDSAESAERCARDWAESEGLEMRVVPMLAGPLQET